MLGGDSQQDCSWVFQSTQRHPKDSDTIAWLRPCLREVKSSEEWCAPRSSWKKGLLASYGSSKLYYCNVGGSFSEKYRSTTFPNARLSSPIRSYLEDLLRALHSRSPPHFLQFNSSLHHILVVFRFVLLSSARLRPLTRLCRSTGLPHAFPPPPPAVPQSNRTMGRQQASLRALRAREIVKGPLSLSART